jgi:hypothetical protein
MDTSAPAGCLAQHLKVLFAHHLLIRSVLLVERLEAEKMLTADGRIKQTCKIWPNLKRRLRKTRGQAMTREEALQNLNLPPDADPEAIEKAYQRLVRRYPPEFHPDKFRAVDDSYRQLTSLPAMLEKLLAPVLEDPKLDPALLMFEPSIPAARIDEALNEIRALALTDALWKPLVAGRTPKGKRPF